MLKETPKLKAMDLIGKVLVQTKDGQDLYKAKIVSAVRNGEAYGLVPNYEMEIVRDIDGASTKIQSDMMFQKIENGTVRFDNISKENG